ncbi:MAG: DNA gyrase inhibitor YacG [Pseudomonadota bacterium]
MTSPSNDNKAAPCPICHSQSVERYSPFCSNRCADVDLHRWLTGGYAIPAVEGEPDHEETAEDA